MKINLFARIALFVLISVFCVALAWADDSGFFGATSGVGLAAVIPIVPISTMKNKRTRLLATIQPAAWPSVSRVQIPRDYVYSRLFARLTYQVDVAAGGGADGALAAEQPWSLIRSLRLEASSPSRPTVSELVSADFPALMRMNAFFNGTPAAVGALAAPGIQAATLCSGAVEIPFYLPRTVDPRSGALNCHELNSLDVVCQWGTDTDIIIGGTRVTTLSNIQLQIHGEEYLDQDSNLQKYRVNLTRFLEFSGISASSAYPIDLKRGFTTRAVMLKQFTQAVGATHHTPVNTVVNAVSVVVNGVPKYEAQTNGLANSGWAVLQERNKRAFGLETAPTGYAIIDLAEDGQLDSLLKSNDYTSMGLVLNTNTIADSRIRVYPVEIVDVNQ